MKKAIATTLAATLLTGSIALANPARLTFDDSGFDYRPNEDEATAYVQLERNGDELRFTFSNLPGTSDLPTVTIDEVTEIDGEDLFGNDLLATVHDLDAVEIERRAAIDRRITVQHEGATLRDTVARYLDAIENLGYTAQPQYESATLQVFTFGSDTNQYRAVFHREADTVQVRIAL